MQSINFYAVEKYTLHAENAIKVLRCDLKGNFDKKVFPIFFLIIFEFVTHNYSQINARRYDKKKVLLIYLNVKNALTFLHETAE